MIKKKGSFSVKNTFILVSIETYRAPWREIINNQIANIEKSPLTIKEKSKIIF